MPIVDTLATPKKVNIPFDMVEHTAKKETRLRTCGDVVGVGIRLELQLLHVLHV